ncbi:MAG: hypothetical protein ACLQCB_04715 [Spirochaetia bacterium]
MGAAAPFMAIGSMIASVAGAGMSAYSSMQSADYNAQVARNNQTIANQNASIALQQGQQQEENKRIQTGEMVSAIGAGEAASGVNPNEGSALNVRASAAETGELDALTIRYNANMQNRNDIYAGKMYGSQAALDTSQGIYGMMSSILGGASSVSNKWWQYQQFGNFANNGASNPNPNNYFANLAVGS